MWSGSETELSILCSVPICSTFHCWPLLTPSPITMLRLGRGGWPSREGTIESTGLGPIQNFTPADHRFSTLSGLPAGTGWPSFANSIQSLLNVWLHIWTFKTSFSFNFWHVQGCTGSPIKLWSWWGESDCVVIIKYKVDDGGEPQPRTTSMAQIRQGIKFELAVVLFLA